MNEPAYLLLEDGTLFHGTSFGAPLAGAVGETCFWTGMTDYQETISDPALSGKILVLTHPGVGNVGVNARDLSSDKPRIRALLVREASSLASNYRSEESLGDYLIRHGIPALTDIDTRALTLHIRESGPLRGIVGSGDPKGLESMFQSESAPAELPLLEEPVEWTEGSGEWRRGEDRSGEGLRIGVLDWGARRELLRLIVDTGASVVRIPMSASEDTIRSLEIDGLILPNGALEPLLKSASLIDGIGALIGKNRCSESRAAPSSSGAPSAFKSVRSRRAGAGRTTPCASLIAARSLQRRKTTATASKARRFPQASRSRTATSMAVISKAFVTRRRSSSASSSRPSARTIRLFARIIRGFGSGRGRSLRSPPNAKPPPEHFRALSGQRRDC